MSKVAILSDTHFGARNDNQLFHGHFEEFYSKLFFPTIDSLNVNTVVHCGDVFDRRKYISYASLNACKRMFFDPMKERKIKAHIIVGNHDSYYRNTLKLNSPRQLLTDYKNCNVIDQPKSVKLPDGLSVTMLPWICQDNQNEVEQHILKTKDKICFAHLELKGYQMYAGSWMDEGMSDTMFRKFDLVYTGHYHHKSIKNNIHYLGSTYDITWRDYDDSRGFHIFDTETKEMEYIENPYKIFLKVFYDDSQESTKYQLANIDFDQCKGKYLKIVIKKKDDLNYYDQFIQKINDHSPIDTQVVEDHLYMNESDLGEEVEDVDKVMKSYIDSMVLADSMKTRLKKIVMKLYERSINDQV